MRTIIKKRTYKAIYRLLDKVSPVPFDCGKLCGAICCSDETACEALEDCQLGIYLLPGEEKVHSQKRDWLEWHEEMAEDYDFPDSWFGKIYFVKCKNPPHCPRELRPIQCRTFPLTPYISQDSVLKLALNNMPLPYECPLISDDVELDKRFIKATYTAWKHLIKEPLIYDLVLMNSMDMDETGIQLKFAY